MLQRNIFWNQLHNSLNSLFTRLTNPRKINYGWIHIGGWEYQDLVVKWQKREMSFRQKNVWLDNEDIYT